MMNIVLAQLKKDILCQRTPLVLWGICLGMGLMALLILRMLPLFHAPDVPNAKVMIGMLSLGGLALACVLAAGFGMSLLVPVLVIRVVQEDVLMGTTAFWLTRPIPRKKLLAAKALFIAVLPLPLILLGGSNVHFGSGAGHFWIAEFAWIAAFAAVSSITSGVRELIAYGLALIFGKAVFAGILGKIWSYFLGDGSAFFRAGLHINAPDFLHLCYFAGFSLVFIRQYLTLQTKRSLAILIATLVAVSLIEMLIGPIPNAPTMR